MKTYYGFGQTLYKGSWKYFDSKFKYPPPEEIQNNKYVDTGRIHIRYISYCNKKDMIEIVGELVNSKNWVRQNVTETGNNFEIKLCKDNIGKIVVYIDEGELRNTVIALIDIKTKKVSNVTKKQSLKKSNFLTSWSKAIEMINLDEKKILDEARYSDLLDETIYKIELLSKYFSEFDFEKSKIRNKILKFRDYLKKLYI